MDGHTFVSWNIPNLVTVVLMGLLGIVAYKTGVAVYKNAQGGS